MKKIILAIYVCAFAFIHITSAQVVSLDTSFNTTGITPFTFYGNIDRAYGCALQPDQKLVTVGLSKSGSYFQLCFARFNVNGTFDNTFGTNGKAYVNMGQQQSIGGNTPRLMVSANGKITAINAGRGTIGNSLDMLLCRLDSNGIIDNSFNGNGELFIDMLGSGTQPDQLNAFDIDASGNIYGAGVTRTGATPFDNDIAVVKINTSGQFVNSFDVDGKKLYNPNNVAEFGRGIKIQADGKILVGANAGANMYVMRIDSTGALDNTFNSTGAVTINFGSSSDMTGLELLSDGRFIVAGTVYGATQNIALARYLPNGTPDVTFGTNGKTTIDLSGTDDVVNNMILSPGNKILVCGQSLSGGTGFDFFAARIDSTGALDLTFNNTGYVRTPTVAGNIDDEGNAIALMNDGRIMMTGTTVYSSAVNEDCSVLRWTDGSVTGIESVAGVSIFTIYPNPIKDFIVVTTPQNEHITFFNSQGRMMLQRELHKGNNRISITSLPQGIYFLKSEKSLFVHRVIKL